MSSEIGERKRLPSISSALLLAAAIGVIETLALILGSGILLNIMGVAQVCSNFISIYECYTNRHSEVENIKFFILHSLDALATYHLSVNLLFIVKNHKYNFHAL